MKEPTTTGSGILEMVAGRYVKTDDVSFAAVSQGVRLNYPPGGTKGWPEQGKFSLAREQSAPADPVRVATVVPEGSGCTVSLTTVIGFFEKDWESMNALLNQVVEEAVDKGLVLIPAAGGFLHAAGKVAGNIVEVLKDVLDLVTSLRSEKMGEVVVRLETHDLDDPRPLDQLPWGQELERSKMHDKQQDSFRYRTVLENWGGKWEVALIVSRICDPLPSSSSSSSSSGPGSGRSSSSGEASSSTGGGSSSTGSGSASSSSSSWVGEDRPGWF